MNNNKIKRVYITSKDATILNHIQEMGLTNKKNVKKMLSMLSIKAFIFKKIILNKIN